MRGVLLAVLSATLLSTGALAAPVMISCGLDEKSRHDALSKNDFFGKTGLPSSQFITFGVVLDETKKQADMLDLGRSPFTHTAKKLYGAINVDEVRLGYIMDSPVKVKGHSDLKLLIQANLSRYGTISSLTVSTVYDFETVMRDGKETYRWAVVGNDKDTSGNRFWDYYKSHFYECEALERRF